MEEQDDINYAVITHLNGQTKSEGKILCKDAAIFHLPLPREIFSLVLHKTLFLSEYLRNANRNLHADYMKIIRVHWIDNIPALRKR